MNIGIIAPDEKVKDWVSTFNEYDNDINISVYPNIDYDNVECVCLWKQPENILSKFKS